MNKELNNDLVAAWNEVNEAIIDLEVLDLSDMIAVLPDILQRLHNARHWLGKYVSDQDVIQDL